MLLRSLLLGAVLLVSAVVSGDDSPGVPLFDGESLQGWEGNPKYWRVEEGAITAEIPAGETLGRNEFLFHEGQVADFELTAEFQIEGGPDANSGFQLRSQRLANGGAAGIQADLDGGAVWLGRICDEDGRGLLVERGTTVSIAPDGRRWVDPFATAESFANLRRPEGWNTYRILATGPHLEVWINGRRVSTLDDHEVGQAEYSGSLALQLHAAKGPVKIRFRDLQLRDLGKTEFPQTPPLAAAEDSRPTQSPVLWHLRANAAAPSPVENAEAQGVVAGMKLVDGFEAELIAAEPDVHQPIAFTFDERGRLWVVEAFSYPNKQPEGEGKDRIRILEDQDGDGVFETKKTFTEGLNLVSGIEVGFGGVWIGAAPQLLFIPDRDADDAPDGPPEVLLDGFGYQDTHETLNSLTWGPDGWLYGNQGVFNTAAIGKPGASDEERTTLRAGIWRFHPVRKQFEVFAHGGSNQWGLGFNEAGDLFMTHCRSYWGGGGTTFAIQNGHFWNQTNSEYAAFVSNAAPEGIPTLQNYLPASARYDSGEGGAGKPGTRAVYGGHSHVGTMLYGGDNWPAIYRDRLFTHNLHGHQINQQINVRQGSAYETFHAGFDMAYVPDPAYVAVDLDYGPDGAVYVIDWVDQQHCHNPRPENWDRTNGRIYRISWGATFQPAKVDLSTMSDAELAELRSHSNRWFANTARRLLQHRATQRAIEPGVVEALRTAVANEEMRSALTAMWMLHAIGQWNAADSEAALSHRDEALRAFAIRIGTEAGAPQTIAPESLARLATSDPSARVRLAVASAMPGLDAEECWKVGAALASHAEDANDRFLPSMIWYGLARSVQDDVRRAADLAQTTPLRSLADDIMWFLTKSGPGRELIVERIAQIPDVADAARLLKLLHFGLRLESHLDEPAAWKSASERFRGESPSANPGSRRICDELAAVFGDEDVLQTMRDRLANGETPIGERREALAILNRVGDRDVSAVYPQLLDDPQLRPQVIPLLARLSDPVIADRLLSLMNSLSPDEKSDALGVLSSRKEFAGELLSAVEDGSFDKKELSSLQIRQMHTLGDPGLTSRLEKLWGKIGGSSEETRALIGKVRQTYTTAPLWAYSEDRGRQVFEKRCAVCHPLDGKSVPLGPNLKGSWRNGLDYFLENIADPNAVVGENYRMTLIVTDAGQVITGLLDSETPTAVVLRTAERTVSVPKGEIEERKIVDQSLMPTGLFDNMSEIEVIELLKFLLKRE